MELNQEPVCPRCGSYSVEKIRTRYSVASGIVLFGLGSWLLNLPLLGVGFCAIGGLVLILTPFLRGSWFCRRCYRVWKQRAPRKQHDRKIIPFPEHNIRQR